MASLEELIDKNPRQTKTIFETARESPFYQDAAMLFTNPAEYARQWERRYEELRRAGLLNDQRYSRSLFAMTPEAYEAEYRRVSQIPQVQSLYQQLRQPFGPGGEQFLRKNGIDPASVPATRENIAVVRQAMANEQRAQRLRSRTWSGFLQALRERGFDRDLISALNRAFTGGMNAQQEAKLTDEERQLVRDIYNRYLEQAQNFTGTTVPQAYQFFVNVMDQILNPPEEPSDTTQQAAEDADQIVEQGGMEQGPIGPELEDPAAAYRNTWRWIAAATRAAQAAQSGSAAPAPTESPLPLSATTSQLIDFHRRLHPNDRRYVTSQPEGGSRLDLVYEPSEVPVQYRQMLPDDAPKLQPVPGHPGWASTDPEGALARAASGEGLPQPQPYPEEWRRAFQGIASQFPAPSRESMVMREQLAQAAAQLGLDPVQILELIKRMSLSRTGQASFTDYLLRLLSGQPS